jgi:hypothetical protein
MYELQTKTVSLRTAASNERPKGNAQRVGAYVKRRLVEVMHYLRIGEHPAAKERGAMCKSAWKYADGAHWAQAWGDAAQDTADAFKAIFEDWRQCPSHGPDEGHKADMLASIQELRTQAEALRQAQAARSKEANQEAWAEFAEHAFDKGAKAAHAWTKVPVAPAFQSTATGETTPPALLLEQQILWEEWWDAKAYPQDIAYEWPQDEAKLYTESEIREAAQAFPPATSAFEEPDCNKTSPLDSIELPVTR